MLIGETNKARKIREMLLNGVEGKIRVLLVAVVVVVLCVKKIVPIAHRLGFAKMHPSWSAKDCHLLLCLMTDHWV